MKRPLPRDGGAGSVWARLLERMWLALNLIFGVDRPGPDRRNWVSIAEDEWRPVLDRLPTDPALRDAIATRLLPAYALANGLAGRFAGLHRGAFTLVAILTTGAVIVGPVSVLTPVSPPLKLTLIVSVLVMITGIVLTTTLSRRGRWHRRWLAYRAEAEALRPLRVLAYAGASAGTVPAPPRVSARMRERIQSAFAALPPPQNTNQPDYVKALKAAAFDGPKSELGGQIAYHRQEADRMARLDTGLRRTHQEQILAIGGKAAETLDDVRAVLVSAVALMSTETAEWQTLIGTRPLTVPV